jgi:thioredoxin reductase
VNGTFAAALGCAIETHPMGSYYRTDPMTKETTVPGVFACGDAAVPMGALPYAAADGFRGGVGARRSLVFPG